jgi:hypothetical protein
MGVVSATPSGLVQTPGAWATNGGNADVVLADADDNTYLQGPSYAPDYARAQVVGLTDVSIPAGAAISGVRVRMRAKDLSTYPWDAQGRAVPANAAGQMGNGVASAWGQTAITDYTGGYETARPGGGPWTVADVNALNLAFLTTTDFFGSGIRFYMAAIDVLYNERPVVATATATSPFGVSRPTVAWTKTDVEGDPQQAYQVKWFSEAQYTAGGFDPSVSTATHNTGEVTSTGQSHQIPIDLVNATTYKAYVRVRQPDVSGQALRSDWTASNAVTIDVTPPAAPGLTYTGNSVTEAQAHIQMAATKNNPEGDTTLVVEYSDDEGATWAPHPAMNGITFAGTTTLKDYEVPLGIARHYRAKVVAGILAGSAWSATLIAPALPAEEWWLKDPLDPTRNVAARISDFKFSLPRPQAAYDPVGRTEHVVITEGTQAPTGSFVITTWSKGEYDLVMALTTSSHVLLLQDVFGRQWYVMLGESDDWELVKATDPTGDYVIRHVHRARFTWRQVARQMA